MKRAWQKALLGTAVTFPFLAFSAESGPVSLLERPQSAAVVQLPSTEVEKPNLRRWAGEWWLGSRMHNFTEGKDEGTGMSVLAGALVDYQMAPWSRFHLDVEARFTSSRIQTRYDDDVSFSGTRLRNGYLGFGSQEIFETRVGVLNQHDLNSTLLINGGRTFPGFREDLVLLNSENARLKVWAQQTMPTSYSLNTQRAEREKTPSFLTETINLMITPAKLLEAEFYATHFRFNNLPAVVAFDSSSLGNSTNGDVAANSEFKYGFEGFVLGSEFDLKLDGPLSFKLGGHLMQNTKAPEKANRGQLMFLEGELRIGREILFRPRYSTYFSESDTSPASYNAWNLGHNNRKGFIAQVELEFVKHGFLIKAEYVQAAMINPDPFQFDREVFLLGVETNHVSF